MRWTCDRCFTTHETDEQRVACRRADRKARFFTVGMFLSVALIVAVACAAWNQYTYGDWTCAFAHCVKVK